MPTFERSMVLGNEHVDRLRGEFHRRQGGDVCLQADVELTAEHIVPDAAGGG